VCCSVDLITTSRLLLLLLLLLLPRCLKNLIKVDRMARCCCDCQQRGANLSRTGAAPALEVGDGGNENYRD